MCLRRRYFVPVATVEATVEEMAMHTFTLDSRGRFTVSLWIGLAIVLLFVSNLLFLVAFLTNGWGIVEAVDDQGNNQTWHFGLWLCCRKQDSLCVGPRWPAYYSTTRALAVLALFGQVLSLAWLIGFALEKLLDYDPCTLWSLVALSTSSALFILMQVATFGALWEKDMEVEEFGDNFTRVEATLSYSYYLTLVTFFLVVLAGVMQIIEIRTSLRRLEMQQPFSEAKFSSNTTSNTATSSVEQTRYEEHPDVLRLSRHRKTPLEVDDDDDVIQAFDVTTEI